MLGLAREVVAASAFGVTGAMSAFTIAFQVPNLVRALFADSALQGAFVPVFTELLEKGERREAFRVASTLFFLISLVLGAATAAVPPAEAAPVPARTVLADVPVTGPDLPGAGWTAGRGSLGAGTPALRSCLGTAALERGLARTTGALWTNPSGSSVQGSAAVLPEPAGTRLAQAYRSRLVDCAVPALLPAIAGTVAPIDTARVRVGALRLQAPRGVSVTAVRLRLPVAGRYDRTLTYDLVHLVSGGVTTELRALTSAPLSRVALESVVQRVSARMGTLQD